MGLESDLPNIRIGYDIFDCHGSPVGSQQASISREAPKGSACPNVSAPIVIVSFHLRNLSKGGLPMTINTEDFRTIGHRVKMFPST
jgi:hypothetical protein